MILLLLLIFLFLGGFISWWAGQYKPEYSRWGALISLLITSALVIVLWGRLGTSVTFHQPWIAEWGISIILSLDGLSLMLISLTLLLGLLALGVSWHDVKKKTGFYYMNFLWILCGITGVFLARDLFLFYFFWELMLVPMYFMISIWGHENRKYASYKFFLFTQLGGLLMLVAIISLYAVHGHQTGVYTFDFAQLIHTQLTPVSSGLILGGFLMAFLIKLPAIPLHSWLPDAHTEAPTAGSVILAGLLLKTGAYGLLRFVMPLFGELILEWSTWGMLIGVVGVLYGAKLAFAQNDLKRLVAYTSISHMGFVIIGVFAMNELAYQGVVIQLIAHGLSTGALFVLVGMIQQRTGKRDITQLGGMWNEVPYLSGSGLILLMASLGLPGLANFIGEFLILAGAFAVNPWLTAIGAIGLILASVYALRMIQGVFYGKSALEHKINDLSLREGILMTVVILFLVFLGLYPKSVTQVINLPGPFEKELSLENDHSKMTEIQETKEVQFE